MKKLLFVLMVLVCALLFSCATTDGAGSSSSIAGTNELGLGYIAAELADNTIFSTWAAKYNPGKAPVYNGKPLVPDQGAFQDLPADIMARKEKSLALEDEGRYLDAWYAYGEDDNEYIIALKIISAVEYYLDTTLYQMFLFDNIGPDLDLIECRESGWTNGTIIFYDPVSVAKKWTDEHCNGVMPHILEMALGVYYSEAAHEFGDEWIMSQDAAINLAADYFKKALAAGVYNDSILFAAADTFLTVGYADEVIEITHCLEISKPDYAFNYYQEGCAYMDKGEYQNALPCAAKAAIYATIPDDVVAACHLMAYAFMSDSLDITSALAVMDAGKPYMGENYFRGPVFDTIDFMMYCNQDGRGVYDKRIQQELTDAFAWNPENPDYLYDLVDYFWNYGNMELCIDWIKSVIPLYGDKPQAVGNLNFELGQFLMQLGDFQSALNCFNTAEEKLTEAGVYNPSTSNIPYYQNVCREKLLSSPKKQKI